jgi:hypothetical protein
MPSRCLVVVALLALAGCARATLPYRPEPQPRGARVSANYQIVGDQLRIEIDTGGHRLEQAWVFRPDGEAVGPRAVDEPPLVAAPGPSVSIGVGGGSFGRGVGVGTGVGVGIPIGGGTTRVRGNTIAWFPLERAGAAPWQLYVKLAGIEPTQFLVGGAIGR